MTQLPALTISKDLSAEGGEGLSLVKGVQMTLKAIALSIKPGAVLGELHVGGSIRTSGAEVVSVELAGPVDRWDVPGGIVATGRGSDGVHCAAGITVPSGVTIASAQGKDVVVVSPAS